MGRGDVRYPILISCSTFLKVFFCQTACDIYYRRTQCPFMFHIFSKTKVASNERVPRIDKDRKIDFEISHRKMQCAIRKSKIK